MNISTTPKAQYDCHASKNASYLHGSKLQIDVLQRVIRQCITRLVCVSLQ
eukprot:COSAG02_NODE_10369_length_1957_cov_2.437029_2_plen_50_part_00